MARMTFKVLDMSSDAAQQGFEVGSYDLIVAVNVSRVVFFSGTEVCAKVILAPKGQILGNHNLSNSLPEGLKAHLRN